MLEIGKKELISAIEDMNRVMELDPPIDTTGSTDEVLSQLDQAIEECVDPADEFTMETWDIINARANGNLKVVDGDRKVDGMKDKKGEGGKSKSKSKGKGKSARGEGKSLGSKEDKKQTRAEVMAQILRVSATRPMTVKEMIREMVERYHGSESEAKFQVGVYIRLVKALGLFEYVNDKLSYKGGKVG